MKIKLTSDGQEKYREAREDLGFSNGKLYRLGPETSTRGKGVALSDERLAEILGWYKEKVGRFFNSNPRYPVTVTEAKAICEVLGIEFDHNDYEVKQGPTLNYLPFLKQTGPSGTRVDELEGRKDDNVVPEDKVPDDTPQPCNPVALRAVASDGSIPDPFASSDFHLKVRVEETYKSQLKLQELEPGGGESLSCSRAFSIYQGQDPIAKDHPKIGQEVRNLMNRFSTELRFLVADPIPLIDSIKELLEESLYLCWILLDNKPLPLNLHLHILLPVTWLSGPLPEAIQRGMGRQVFFSRSKRAKLAESAITQLRVKAIRVNQALYSGGAISNLLWATVCDGAVQPVPLAQVFQSAHQATHLSVCDLDNEVDHRKLVGRDALLAAEHRFLFAERFSDADEGSTEGRLVQRWKRLAKIGLPLVFWWRGAGTLAESARLDRLEAVLKGSWSEFCDALHLLPWEQDPTEKDNEETIELLANLGIFYEEPLRLLMPDHYRDPSHTTP